MALKLSGDVNSPANLASLNTYLATKSYIDGYTPSSSDVVIADAISSSKLAGDQYAHVARWFRHISAYSAAEKKAFPGVKKSLADFGAEGGAKAAAGGGDDDDDDLDLFGEEEDAEAAKVREERLKAYAEKKAKKPTVIAKSNVILDVKPWDDETDMKAMEAEVRKISTDGLIWGISKLQPIAYGLKKLQIVCVVEDDKVSIDWLTEEIEKIEDYVQSVDVAAFQKI
ncbi:elongation factor 1-beta'-like [Panonychus citri]|uniref:elongation factor 1-beta'-like n=1 Tax=Panonychus citri TaxID=50023 RepID=UPI0023074BED|nr:elongation factor 1-beta'-like [Panonychus citri]XP_053214512.1 elongation factor 1-beta'-like [Panonychus citri]